MPRNKKSKDFDKIENNEFNIKCNIVESFETSFIDGDITFEYGSDKSERKKVAKLSKSIADMFSMLISKRNKKEYGTYILMIPELYDLLIQCRIQGMIKGKLSNEDIRLKNIGLNLKNKRLEDDVEKLKKKIKKYESKKLSLMDRRSGK